MFDEVPEPVWKTSMGNASRCRPAASSSAAATIAAEVAPSITPSSAFTRAAADFTSPNVRISRGSRGVPLIGKFSQARCVWARQSASFGTAMSPIESCSILCSLIHQA